MIIKITLINEQLKTGGNVSLNGLYNARDSVTGGNG